jgi:hypothetical protein
VFLQNSIVGKRMVVLMSKDRSSFIGIEAGNGHRSSVVAYRYYIFT